MLLELPALRGHSPVGFMAALGLLRVAPAGAQLSWNRGTQAAELHGVGRDELISHLLLHMRGRSASAELNLADDVRKYDLERFRAVYDAADESLAEWVRAWWREEGKETRCTDLCLTGGPQRMIKMARELAQSLDPMRSKNACVQVQAKFEEALFGPWRYEDNFASWGWDPATYRPGALTPNAPTAMKTAGVAGAYWLAWEAQPLFPCINGRGTLGFESRPRAWTWGTWSEPLDIHAVQALLRQPQEVGALGGTRYRSGIVFAGQIQFFEPASVCV